MIALLGDDIDDRMAVSGVKWLQSRNCNVMTMAPAKKDYGHHSYPLERFEKAIGAIKQKGNRKIGIVGASTTGMMALVAASYYRDISLTVAMTPCDFIMEGFVRDGKDSMKERPADGESTVTVDGKTLPYLPYAYPKECRATHLDIDARVGRLLQDWKMGDGLVKMRIVRMDFADTAGGKNAAN